jgi:hypothetical protein
MLHQFSKISSISEKRAARSFAVPLGMAVMMFLLAGCSSEPFQLVPVEGKISYEDGAPIPAESIMIRFVPLAEKLDDKTHARPGTTFVQADGTFHRVTTHKANDGIVRGRHKVLVKAGNAVPERYMRVEETPIEVDTKDSPFHIRVKRPE